MRLISSRISPGSIWCTSILLGLLATVLATAQGINNSIDDGSGADPPKRNTICIPGLNTWGAIAPRGDIKLEVGDTLELNCTIDRSSPKVGGLTSANIKFSFTKHEIPESQMQVAIVDETTASLRVPRMNVSTPRLYCDLVDPTNGSLLLHVCQTQINVGHRPLQVENFRCVAREWRSLNCSWTKPFNPVQTDYELSNLMRRFGVQRCGQDNEYNGTFSCEWNGITEPHYQQNTEKFVLLMNGTNVLKPDGVQWRITVDHWAIIIPAKPEKLTTQAVSPNEVELSWEFAHYEHFKPGLQHRVTLCATDLVDDQVDACLTKEFVSHYKDVGLKERIRVPYAFSVYRVEVQMKSTASKNDTNEFWSVRAVSSVRTLAKKPDSPPRTTAGSYQVSNKYQVRDIHIYWQNIQPYMHNGSDFHLEFTVHENGRLRNDIRPTEVTSSGAHFANMSMKAHTFQITAVNAMGRSDDFATVQVPNSPPQGPSAPLSVTKMFYSNGTYEISWKPPTNAVEVVSYTIFVCNGSRHSPYQCNVLLSWNVVDPGQTTFIYTDLPAHVVFQFGVSVNTKDKGSSGMVLANCELVFNKVPGKITDVQIGAKTPTTLQVRWNLDCAYQPGRIEGFRITYCLVNPSSPDTCPEANKHVIRASPNDSEHMLQHLEPFSTYNIAISIITRAGESELSDPVSGTTAETAPSDPPQVRAIESTNTSGIIAIEVPANPNGVLQKFKIIYTPIEVDGTSSASEERTRDISFGDLMENKRQLNLTNLQSNLNYSVSVMACTVSCSNASEPAFLMTKVGSTNLTRSPTISYADDTFTIGWEIPARMGGPVDYFEVAVKRNGEFVDDPRSRRVSFKSGQKKYEQTLSLQCDSNTNLSVQVRAVSLVNNEVLPGEWSPEGSLSCSGVAAWILWLIGLGVVTILVIVIAALSTTFYRHCRICVGVRIKLPTEFELEPPDGKKKRQNSGGDTHSLGKENMIYKLYLASTQADETKDFLQTDPTKEMGDGVQRQDSAIYVDSSVDNNSFGGSITGSELPSTLQESIDQVLKMGLGKVADWSWHADAPMVTSSADGDIIPCRSSCLFAPGANNTNTGEGGSRLGVENPVAAAATAGGSLNLSSNQSSTVDEDDSAKGTSPSPNKPLLSDSIHYADDDGPHDEDFIHLNETEQEHYKKLGYRRDDDEYHRHYATPRPRGPGGGGPSHPHSLGTSTPSPSSRSHSSNSSSSSGPSHGSGGAAGSSSKEAVESQPQPHSTASSYSSSSSLTPTATALAPDGGVGVVIPKVPITNPYITWTYLKNDHEPTIGGGGGPDGAGVGVENHLALNQPQYYQVGIAMDSA